MHEYILALAGGVMIGCAAVLLMATNGSIMGVSGIVSRLLPPAASDWHWRLTFVAGVFAAPLMYQLTGNPVPDINMTQYLPAIMAGGILVGAGTVVGSGCTSGHGICGLSRVSVRSFVATLTFMVTAIATVYVSRHVFGV